MPSIAEMKKLRAQVEKERAKAAGQDAATLNKVMEAKRQAEYDVLTAELDQLKDASKARGDALTIDAPEPTAESREEEAKRLLKASQKVMSGTPIEEVRAPKPSTSAQSSTPTPTNGGK